MTTTGLARAVMNEVLDIISIELSVPRDILRKALSRSKEQVRHIRIPKKDGSYRTIYQPSKRLKVIQYWLIYNVLSKLPVHHAATGFQQNKSIKTNALMHRRKRYFLKLDFKNFFPSIKFDDIHTLIMEWHSHTKSLLNCDDLCDLIMRSCFYPGDSLPIGYPTSPIISNVVMYTFDSRITAYLLKDRDLFGDVVYTRYADDMIFSTNVKGACNGIKEMTENIVASLESPHLTINSSKTRLVSSSGGSAVVTGLRICHDGHITVHRDYKNKLRLLLYLFEKGKLDKDDIQSLKGHLVYIKHVDPRLYTKLQSKYFKSISSLSSV